MARVLILTTHKDLDRKNEIIHTALCGCECCECRCNEFDYNKEIEKILDRAFCTNCPDCVAKFMEDLKKLGLFKCLWEPIKFVRNEAIFKYETSKYFLGLHISIVDKEHRISRNDFMTQFDGVVSLKIRNKRDSNKTKTVVLFDLHCDSMDKGQKDLYVEQMRSYIEETFGIDFARWNEILNQQYSGKMIQVTNKID